MRAIPRNSGWMFVLSVLEIIFSVQSYHGCPFHFHRSFGIPPQRPLHHHYYTPPIQRPGEASNSRSSACVTQPSKCDSKTFYHSYDGSCNNLQNPSWGRSGTPFNRLLPANYEDSKCALRKASNGKDLPLARLIRTFILENHEIPSRKFNILFYAYGQWIDHDVSGMSPMNTQNDCCSNSKKGKSSDSTCLPIIIPEKDSFYSQYGVTCLDLKRANNTYSLNCDLEKPCTPVNFQTSWIDLSILYGPNQQTINELRLFKKGLLKFTNDSMTSYQLYPLIVSGVTNCPLGGIDNKRGGHCFKAGDIRVNQNPEITIIELVFYKLHQIMAVALSTMFKTDEEIFQEARRMLIACLQHVTYGELVPLTVGYTAAMKFDLLPRKEGYSVYKSQVNGQTFTEYPFAAGRAFHSEIAGEVSYFDGGKSKSYKLRQKYFNQRFLLGKGMFENMMQSYSHTDCNEQDEFGSEEITNWLLANATSYYGSDLIATDILRGRDAGLETYNAYRHSMGMPEVRDFSDMLGEVKHQEVIPKLASVYNKPEDMDLYVAGLAEKNLPDSSVGPTFTRILCESFYRWKFGDRLFYEFLEAGFPLVELNELRKVTFAFLLCLANPSQRVPKNAFLIPSPSNPLVDCHTVLQNGPNSKIWNLIRSTHYHTI